MKQNSVNKAIQDLVYDILAAINKNKQAATSRSLKGILKKIGLKNISSSRLELLEQALNEARIAFFRGDEVMTKLADFASADSITFRLASTRLAVQVPKSVVSSTSTQVQSPPSLPLAVQVSKVKRKLGVVEQKNALQVLLQKYVGIIEVEKKFPWLVTPSTQNGQLPQAYQALAKALKAYRGNDGFLKRSNYQLLCDIVLDSHKLIIEYDERQHFSAARQVTLMHYPQNLALYFSKEDWIKACEQINAQDNDPADRDEKRAFYDAVRDIEAARQGYKLIRIQHEKVDWEAEGAELHLKNLLLEVGVSEAAFQPVRLGLVSPSPTARIHKHKIARIIIGEDIDGLFYERLGEIISQFVASEWGKRQYEFILAPGGFLEFEFSEEFQDVADPKIIEDQIEYLYQAAELVVEEFFAGMPLETLQKLRQVGDYFTFGVDSAHNQHGLHAELVAVYDLKQAKVVHWTGKSYPVEQQKNSLVRVKDLNTHCLSLNGQRVLVLGCHDLNIYSPRGQAKLLSNSPKKRISEDFRNLAKAYEPEIVLQHPHTTDSPKIWLPAWAELHKELLSVKHSASGINYYSYYYEEARDDLDKVLNRTQQGDVINFVEESLA